jgi:hypothetical protein
LKLDDGFPTTIAFEADPDVSFWEKTVTPPGLDGGDAIDQTTMHNISLRTFASRELITMTECTVTAAYDPSVIPQILALINVEGSITVHYPNGDTLDFFGYLRVYEPQEMSEGTQPECNITIQPTNYDPVTGAETEPDYTVSGGT